MACNIRARSGGGEEELMDRDVCRVDLCGGVRKYGKRRSVGREREGSEHSVECFESVQLGYSREARIE